MAVKSRTEPNEKGPDRGPGPILRKLPSVLLARRDHHDHLPPLQARKRFDLALSLHVISHAVETSLAEILVGHLGTTAT